MNGNTPGLEFYDLFCQGEPEACTFKAACIARVELFELTEKPGEIFLCNTDAIIFDLKLKTVVIHRNCRNVNRPTFMREFYRIGNKIVEDLLELLRIEMNIFQCGKCSITAFNQAEIPASPVLIS